LLKESPVAKFGLTNDELQTEIARRMARMDEAQEEEEHLGPYGDLLRMVAVIAFQRAADLITANNRRIERQLAAAGIVLEDALIDDSSLTTED
jgi:predicted nucleic acid-binding protein